MVGDWGNEAGLHVVVIVGVLFGSVPAKLFLALVPRDFSLLSGSVYLIAACSGPQSVKEHRLPLAVWRKRKNRACACVLCIKYLL